MLDWLEKILDTGINGQAIKTEQIGIITPYKSQVKLIKKLLELNQIDGIEVDTIEGYQGREKDIIVISTVRSDNSCGFLKDNKRTCVLLSRAKKLMIIFLHEISMRTNETWSKIIDNSQQANPKYFQSFVEPRCKSCGKVHETKNCPHLFTDIEITSIEETKEKLKVS